MGFDTVKAINRIGPQPNLSNFEPNYIPFIEFSEADFPWRYSLTTATSLTRNWIPWITLIVLKAPDGSRGEGEYEEVNDYDPSLPARIKVKDLSTLPDLKESWRWAHAQVNVERNINNVKDLREVVHQRPEDTVSRLLCARRLAEKTKYTAMVVPTYKVGLQAALGQSQNVTNELAWDIKGATSDVIIPYYYKWDFRSGARGDFEYLLRLLEPRTFAGLGSMKVSLGNMGYGVRGKDNEVLAAKITMNMEGALASANFSHQRKNKDISEALKELLFSSNVRTGNTANTERRLVPPVYGEYYEEKRNLDRSRSWLAQLNLDPKYRAAASLGARYVQENQEQLMEDAWNQLGEYRKRKQELENLKLATAASDKVFERLKSLGPKEFTHITTPVHRNVRGSEVEADGEKVYMTVFDVLSAVGIPKILTDPSIKRVYNKKSISTPVRSIEETADWTDFTEFQQPFTEEHSIPSTSLLVNSPLPSGGANVESLNTEIVRLNIPNSFLHGPLTTHYQSTAWFSQQIEASQPNTFMGVEHRALRSQTSRIMQLSGSIMQDETSAFENQTYNDTIINTKAAIDPKLAYDRFANYFRSQTPPDYHPRFFTPLYEYLRDNHPEYMVPGLEVVPQNTVMLLASNQKFIEAFMVGANHELARELRWREFPADSKGTFFRKFWDTSIYSVSKEETEEFKNWVIQKSGDQFASAEEAIDSAKKAFEEQSDPERARVYEEALEEWLLTREEDQDIKPIHKWGNNLGGNGMQTSSDSQVILVIRGDLIRKYPNLNIHLVGKENAADNSIQPALTKKESYRYPIFEGSLPPDITMIGFPVSSNDAKDFYIMLEEERSDLRFGLDTHDSGDNSEVNLDNLAWEDFEPPVEDGFYLTDNLLKDVENRFASTTGWKATAAQCAKVFRQPPVRVAIDLKRLLPHS